MPSRKFIAVTLTGALLALIIAFNLPYEADARQKLETPVFLNIPCEQTLVKFSPDSQSRVHVDLNGAGFGRITLDRDGKELRLLKLGLLFDISCTATVELAKDKIIYLPEPMPFVAQGVLPTTTEKILPGTGFNWRKFEGFR